MGTVLLVNHGTARMPWEGGFPQDMSSWPDSRCVANSSAEEATVWSGLVRQRVSGPMRVTVVENVTH